MNEEEQKETKEEPEESNSKSHGFIIAIFVILFIVAMIFAIHSCVTNVSNPYNSDGGTSPFRRSANVNDITINSELNLSALGANYVINPKVDIDGLEITVNFMDSNRNSLKKIAKSLGNVKEGVQVTFTISLVELGFSAAMQVEYESATVTGGTVSYFA